MTIDISDIWDDDLLGRETDARFIIEFLINRIAERGALGGKRCFVLNVDAEWGHGKTFFIDRLGKTIERYGMFSVTINAWADDHADDPLIAVMAAIDQKISTLTKVSNSTKLAVKKLTAIGGRVAYAAAKGAVKQAAEKLVGAEAVGQVVQEIAQGAGREAGKTVEEIYDAEGKKLFDKFTQGKRSISDFKTQLSKVLESVTHNPCTPLFVLIDELDRCRPTYAIALLERTKHLFDVDNIIFVFATNADQLRHSIAAAYGSTFDASRYLHRFFDQTYRFGKPDREDYVEAKLARIDESRLSTIPNTSQARFMLDGFNAFSLSLRDIDQCFEILSDCVTAWNHPVPLELPALLPLIIAQQQRLELTFDRSLITRIEQSRGAKAGEWHIRAGYNRTNGQQGTIEVVDLFDRYTQMSRQSVNKILDTDAPASTSPEHIVREAFRSETGHRPRALRGEKSWVSSYVELVRTVGRLTPTDSDNP
ncbi:MAG TPA: P-loop NTPase fold protein [Blastocatellia bacterium]|nr:P-loop NTPase fold protein [Blastocatellia bacterium]